MLLQHAATAMLSVILTGFAFFMLESRNHVAGAEFQKHLDTSAPMVRQADEERGRVETRLAHIEKQLVEIGTLLREMQRAR